MNQRGVHAADNIKDGETILRVPYNAILSPEVAKNELKKTDLGKKILE